MNRPSMRGKAAAAKRRNAKTVAAPDAQPITPTASPDEASPVVTDVAAATTDASAPGAKPPAANDGDSLKAGKAGKAAKPGKAVTYSVTVTGDEARQLEALRTHYQRDGAKLKKSIMLRAALRALADIDPERLGQIVAQAAEGHARAKPRKTSKKRAKK